MQQSIHNVKSHYLYNMLQDFRHLLIFDLRSKEEFEDNHIRDSFNLHPEINKEQAQQVLKIALQKNEQKEEKYRDLKKVRRYFFIDSITFAMNAPNIAYRVSMILENLPKDPTNKIYGLADKYSEFHENYPYVCLVKSEFDKLRKEGVQQKQIQKLMLYPYCRFPTQIIPNKLYLGNIYSSNSQKQLQDMGIKNLIDCIDYSSIEQSSQMVPQFKNDSSKYDYTAIPFNKDVPVGIDFDKINTEIDKKVNSGRTLVYCRDGQTISAAIAIGYLMFKAKLDVGMATLKICQAIGRSQINKWMYTQLLVYKPKK